MRHFLMQKPSFTALNAMLLASVFLLTNAYMVTPKVQSLHDTYFPTSNMYFFCILLICCASTLSQEDVARRRWEHVVETVLLVAILAAAVIIELPRKDPMDLTIPCLWAAIALTLCGYIVYQNTYQYIWRKGWGPSTYWAIKHALLLVIAPGLLTVYFLDHVFRLPTLALTISCAMLLGLLMLIRRCHWQCQASEPLWFKFCKKPRFINGHQYLWSLALKQQPFERWCDSVATYEERGFAVPLDALVYALSNTSKEECLMHLEFLSISKYPNPPIVVQAIQHQLQTLDPRLVVVWSMASSLQEMPEMVARIWASTDEPTTLDLPTLD